MVLNGRLPESYLASTVIGGRLSKGAARSADRLALAFVLDTGKSLVARDTYRSYSQQVEVKARLGTLAAPPGTSNHGWGTAVDFASDINQLGSWSHDWMRANAGAFGWVWPDWANPYSSRHEKTEPWHWEWHDHLDRRKNAPYIRVNHSAFATLGDRGERVREVQRLLNEVLPERNRVPVDGDFGMVTAAAVYRFQHTRGIWACGYVGNGTIKALRNRKPYVPPARRGHKKPSKKKYLNIKGIQSVVRAKKDNVFGPDTTKRLIALREAGSLYGNDFPYGKKFAQGVVGVRQDGVWGRDSRRAHDRTVKKLQKVLRWRGLYKGAIDGRYGSGTERAVQAAKDKARKG